MVIEKEQKSSATVEASLHFLKQNTLYKEEKPYAFRYEINTEDVPQSNMEMERVDYIPITDMRGIQDTLSIEANGFEVIEFESKLSYGDFFAPERVDIYLCELEKLLRLRLGASKVKTFRYGIRKRHPNFPLSTGKTYEYDQPTSVAHVDTTRDEVLREIRRQHGSASSELLKKRNQWINIWKPLKGPLNDWPLTICDSSTVQEDTDLEAADLLYPDLATENYQIYYRSKYRWYYLSDHKPSELIIFKQADSLEVDVPGVPHCSFYNSLVPQGEPPRESIEVRALVCYDD